MPTLSSALVKQKVASMADVEEALARQVLYGGDLATNLLEAAPVREAQLTETLARCLELEAAPVGQLPRASEGTLRLLPAELAIRHGVYPLEERAGELVVAVSEALPEDVETDLGFSLGVRVVQRAAPLVRIRQALARDYGAALDRRLERLISKLEGHLEPAQASAQERPPSGTLSLPGAVPLPLTGFPSEPPIGLRPPAQGPSLDPQLMRPLGGQGAPQPAAPNAEPAVPAVALASMDGAGRSEDGPGEALPDPVVPTAASSEGAPAESDAVRDAPDESAPPTPTPITPAPAATRQPASLPAAPAERAQAEPGEGEHALPGAAAGMPPLHAATLVSMEPPARVEVKLATERHSRPERTYTLPSAQLSSLVRSTPRQAPDAGEATAITGERPRSPRSNAPRASSRPISDPAALASWARSSLPAPPNRPRRGPYTPALAEQDLLAAQTRDDVMSAFFHFFVQYFEYSALFVVHPDFMEGRDGYGPGAGRAELAGVSLSFDAQSSPRAVRDRGTYALLKLDPSGGDARLLHDLRRPGGRVALLLPVMVRGRCVLMLYGDHGAEDVELSTIGDVIAFAQRVSSAFERVILSKKKGALGGGAVEKTLERMPRPPNRRSDLPSREKRAGALAQALGAGASSRPPPAASAPPAPLVASSGAAPVAPSSPPVRPAAASAPPAVTSASFSAPEPPRSSAPVVPAHFASRSPAAPVKAPAPARSAAARPPVEVAQSAAPFDDLSTLGAPRAEPAASAAAVSRVSVPSAPAWASSRPPPKKGPGAARFPAPPNEPSHAAAPLGSRRAAEDEKTPVATPAIRASWTAPVAPPPVDIEEAFPLTRRTSRPPPEALSPAVGPEIAISDAMSDAELDGVLEDVLAIEIAEAGGEDDVDEAPPESSGEDDLDDDWEDGVVSQDGKAPLAPSTRSVRFGARRLRPRHSAHEIKLPSVIVDVESDLRMLVDRIVSGDEGAAEQLREMGDEGVSALVSRFPGPITNEPRLGGPSLRPSRCGPVLHALVRIGRPAVPYLAVRTADGDATVRAWATRLLGEIPSPEGAEAIARRFMDQNEDVRRAALAGARLLENNLPAQASLRAALTRAAADRAQTESARHAAIEALADLRAPEALPELIPLLEDPSPEIVESAHWALVVTARQDFGTSAAAWRSWWERASGRHRIQWLIDSLTHDNPEIRRAAGEELKSTTKEYFGYYDDLPKKERARAQERYREWWETRGRILFS